MTDHEKHEAGVRLTWATASKGRRKERMKRIYLMADAKRSGGSTRGREERVLRRGCTLCSWSAASL